MKKKYAFWRNRYLYIMVIPALIWFLIFSYGPMIGVNIAFRNFLPGDPFVGTDKFVGFDNFRKLFQDNFFWRSFRNSVIIAIMRIIICLPAAIILALLFCEVRNRIFKSIVQTITYIPHFLSWVVVSVFAITFFNPEMGLNYLLRSNDMKTITMTDNNIFRYIVVGADAWKDMGFNSVLFIAAILGINPALYESAAIDGAGRIKRIIYITLPCIRNTIMAVLVLWIGIIINVGFDQVFNMYNPAVYPSGDIIDTFIYRTTFSSGSAQYGVATAAGLFKGVISMLLIFLANLFSKSIGEDIIF